MTNKEIKILAVGNSFSDDALAYLYHISRSGAVKLQTGNLMIGGCSLETHWANAENDAAAYLYQVNASVQAENVSIGEALRSESWTHVTLQQASPYSGMDSTYFPYIVKLREYIKRYAPQAEILIHQTWAYEIDFELEIFQAYERDQTAMYHALSAAYQQAADRLGARVIPVGDVIQRLRRTPPFDYERGGLSLCRDGFHLSIPYGRYAAAAVWHVFLTGEDITQNGYAPPCPENVTETEHREKVKSIQQAVREYFELEVNDV